MYPARISWVKLIPPKWCKEKKLYLQCSAFIVLFCREASSRWSQRQLCSHCKEVHILQVSSHSPEGPTQAGSTFKGGVTTVAIHVSSHPSGIECTSQDVLEVILHVAMSAAQTDEFLQFASGGRVLPGSVPLAHRYGGHQVDFLFTHMQWRNVQSKNDEPWNE